MYIFSGGKHVSVHACATHLYHLFLVPLNIHVYLLTIHRLNKISTIHVKRQIIYFSFSCVDMIKKSFPLMN